MTSPDQAALREATTFCWLIERSQREQHEPPIWWVGPGIFDWSGDAHRARRFPSQTEAEAMLRLTFGRWDADPKAFDKQHVEQHGFIENPLREAIEWVRERDPASASRLALLADAAERSLALEAIDVVAEDRKQSIAILLRDVARLTQENEVLRQQLEEAERTS